MTAASSSSLARADRSQRTTLILLAIGLTTALAIGAVAAVTGAGTTPAVSPIRAAAEEFRSSAPDAVERCCESLAITIDDGDQAAVELAALTVLVRRLGFPMSTVDRITATRAIDGAQQAETDQATVWWSYHPDSGLHVIIDAA